DVCSSDLAHERITWSPGFSRSTAGPTFSTTPAPSSPSTMGTLVAPHEPSAACRHEWQTPLAAIRTSTSFCFGSSSSTSSTVCGSRTACSTGAFMVIDIGTFLPWVRHHTSGKKQLPGGDAMPIYEYRCSNCGTDFELTRPISQASDPAPCPTCKKPA